MNFLSANEDRAESLGLRWHLPFIIKATSLPTRLQTPSQERLLYLREFNAYT